MLHVNYARARSPARRLACSSASCALCPSLIGVVVFERKGSAASPPLSPIDSSAVSSFSLVPSFFRSQTLFSSYRSRANILRRSGFLRAIEIISINRRLSDTAKLRVGPRQGGATSTRYGNIDKMRRTCTRAKPRVIRPQKSALIVPSSFHSRPCARRADRERSPIERSARKIRFSPRGRYVGKKTPVGHVAYRACARAAIYVYSPPTNRAYLSLIPNALVRICR